MRQKAALVLCWHDATIVRYAFYIRRRFGSVHTTNTSWHVVQANEREIDWLERGVKEDGVSKLQ